MVKASLLYFQSQSGYHDSTIVDCYDHEGIKVATGSFSPGGEIRTLTVIQGRRGKGIGTALLKEMEKRMTTSHHFYVLAYPCQSDPGHDKEALQKFYTNNGYVPMAYTSFWHTILYKLSPSLTRYNNWMYKNLTKMN